MKEIIRPGLPAPFFLRPLQTEDAGTAAALCDRFVGKNLYSEAELAALPSRPGQFFYLLYRDGLPSDAPVGYLYFLLTDLAGAAERTKLPEERLLTLSPHLSPVGFLRSIGIDERFRGLGLSESLIAFALERLAALSAELVLGACWKKGEAIPMDRTLRSLGFCYLADAPRLWYDIPALICPHCGGRCRCDAAVYYKILEKEDRA